MEIKRTIDTKTATYDITGLTHEQFSHLYRAYEKQWYIYCNRWPEKGSDPLLDKLREMAEKIHPDYMKNPQNEKRRLPKTKKEKEWFLIGHTAGKRWERNQIKQQIEAALKQIL